MIYRFIRAEEFPVGAGAIRLQRVGESKYSLTTEGLSKSSAINTLCNAGDEAWPIFWVEFDRASDEVSLDLASSHAGSLKRRLFRDAWGIDRVRQALGPVHLDDSGLAGPVLRNMLDWTSRSEQAVITLHDRTGQGWNQPARDLSADYLGVIARNLLGEASQDFTHALCEALNDFAFICTWRMVELAPCVLTLHPSELAREFEMCARSESVDSRWE